VTDPGSTKSEFLSRLRARDDEAWRRFAALYGPWLYALCRREGLQPNDAADVMQEVLWKVASKLDGFHHDSAKGSFRGWLSVVARNELYDHLRARGKRPLAVGGTDFQRTVDDLCDEAAPGENSESGPAPTTAGRAGNPPSGALPSSANGSSIAEMDMGAVARRALDRIAREVEPSTLRAFMAMAVEGRSSAEIAAELGISKNAVRNAKARVLRRLRLELGEA